MRAGPRVPSAAAADATEGRRKRRARRLRPGPESLHAHAAGARNRRRPGARRGAARGPRGCDVAPLQGRRHHHPGSLGPGAQEGGRQPVAFGELLRGHDLERFHRREALGEPVSRDPPSGERRRGLSARQVHLQRRLHHQQRTRLQGQHRVFRRQPGHVRRPDDADPRLPPWLGSGVPRHQGPAGFHRERSHVPRARRSSRLFALAHPDPDAQCHSRLQLRAAHRSGLSRQSLPQDPLSLAGPGRRIHAHRPSVPDHPYQQFRLPAAQVLPAVPRRAHRAVPLLPRHLGHHGAHRGGRLHPPGAQALDPRRELSLLPPGPRRLLQRLVPARQLPELHGT